ncbi:MAG: LPD38 domain-containing protein [Paracoccus sp. (in: a-proteobacteria)]
MAAWWEKYEDQPEQKPNSAGGEWWQKYEDQPAAAPVSATPVDAIAIPERTWGEAFTDRALGIGAAGLDLIEGATNLANTAFTDGTVRSEFLDSFANVAGGYAENARRYQSDKEKALQRGLGQAFAVEGGALDQAGNIAAYLWDNPSAIGQVADSLPSSFAAGGALGNVAKALGATGKTLTAANLVGQAGTAGVMSGEGAADAVLNPDNLSAIMASPEYQQALLVAEGDHGKALQYLAAQARTAGAGSGFLANLALLGIGQKLGLNVVEDALIGRLPSGASSRVAGALFGGAKETIGEGAQGGFDQVSQNVGEMAGGLPTTLDKDIGGSALLEALMGAPMGAVVGALGEPASRNGPDLFKNPPPIEPAGPAQPPPPAAPESVGVAPEATDDLNAMLEAAGIVDPQQPAPALEPKQPKQPEQPKQPGQPKAERTPFIDADQDRANQFEQKAVILRERGVPDELIAELTPKARRDSVTGFVDARTENEKARTIQRAIDHVRNTGEPAVFVSADFANLGGLNEHFGNKADPANVPFGEISRILEGELRGTGADVLPMRTGGDEFGFVVVNVTQDQLSDAMATAEAMVSAYAEQAGIASIPRKGGGDPVGVGLHIGMADIAADGNPVDIAGVADEGVHEAKIKGRSHVRNSTPATAGAVAPERQSAGTVANPGAAESVARADEAASQPNDERFDLDDDTDPFTGEPYAADDRGSAPAGRDRPGEAAPVQSGAANPDGPNPRGQPSRVSRPRQYLAGIAQSDGLNWEAFRRQYGLDPVLYRGGKGSKNSGMIPGLFRKDGGLMPDDLREGMIDDGWLLPDPENAPPVSDLGDVGDFLFKGLDNKEGFALGDDADIDAMAAEGWDRYFQQKDEDEAAARAEAEAEKESDDYIPGFDDDSSGQQNGYGNDVPFQRRSVDQTQTPEFKRWFGDSKVVDENGEPLVVYHGTRGDFDTFSTSKSVAGSGAFYFSPNPTEVNGYAGKGSVMPVFLSLQNPYMADGYSKYDFNFDPDKFAIGVISKADVETLTARGYDGMILNRPDRPAEIAVFSPNQIKSATGNNGQFDPNNPDIRFQRSGDLFGAPTSRELTDAARRAKDDQRNGRTGGDRTDMMAGPGELFAGPRPQQEDLTRVAQAEQTDASRRLNRQFNGWLRTEGRGSEQFRAREIPKAALPDALRRALRALEAATGKSIHVIRNLTPEVETFNGLTFRDGHIYIDEKADMPATLVASHEFVHELEGSDPGLYQELADEVQRQGNLPAWIERMADEGNTTDPRGALAELVADATADAMTDPAFLNRMAKESPTLFRRVATAFREFLDSLLGRIPNRGTNAYLQDVEAFRDKLIDVLRRYEERRTGDSGVESTTIREGVASYGETSPLPNWQRRGAAKGSAANIQSEPAVQGGQLELFAADGDTLAETQARVFRSLGKTVNVATGQFSTGVERVTSWQDAAHIVAPLRKRPQEHMAALVLDSGNRPIAVIKHSVGEVAGASVERWSLAGAVAAVPGARSVYFAHNHPSGVVSQSDADKRVTSALADLLKGSGIDAKGMIVVGPGSDKASFVGISEFDNSRTVPEEFDRPTTAARNKGSVPVTERVIRRVAAETGQTINGHSAALSAVRITDALEGGPDVGVLLLDTRHRVIGHIALTADEARKMRSGNASTGIAALLRDIHEASASAAITWGDRPGAENVSKALDAADVRTLDVFVREDGDNFVSLAASRQLPYGPFFQRRTRQQAEQQAETRRDAVAQTLPVNRGTPGWNYDAGKWEGRKGQLRKARAALDDKMISWRDAQDQIAEQIGKAIPDAQDVVRLENLMHGRVGEGIDQLEAKHIEPLVKAMRDAGVKLEQMEEYLYARHAEERNKEIAKINPRMQDGGSGMSTAEARRILAGADRAKLEPLAKRVDAITKATRKRLLDHGLITREQFDAMENQYSAYVPLRGKAEQEIARQAGGAGRGLDTRPQPVKNALGRGDGNLAENILAEVFGDAQRAIILSEKARVGRAAMRLALANPNPALWQVEPVQVRRELDSNGDVVERVIEDFSDPRVIAVRHEGKLYRLWIADVNMASAMNNAGVESLNTITRAAGAFNRYLSAVFTKYNPAFTPVNAARDAIFGLTGIAVEHGELAALDAAVHYPQAAAAAWRHAADKSGSGTWDQWAREFANAGGKTGYVNMPSVEDIYRKIGRGGLRGYSPTGLSRAAQAVGDVVGNLNDAVENALRLSAYVTLRKRGASAEQAAAYAKDLTVNFNRKGNMGSALNAWWLFYNASMQGAKRAGTIMRKPKAMGYVGTLAGIQAVAALAMMGMKDDEDDESLWDKTPDYVKRRNLVIPIGSEHILTIPMPYGFNLFTYLAGKTAGWAKDGRKPNESAAAITGDVLSAAVESFSPVPLDDGALGLLPTALRIPTNIATNRNDFGNRIRNENPYSKSDVPLAGMGRPDTLELFKLTATGLNRIGGGDDFTPPVGMLDWAPEDIEYLVKTLSGGTGKFIVDVATVGEAAANGEDLAARDVPITSRFVSNIDQQAAQASAYYDRRESIDRAIRKLRATYRAEGYDAAKHLIEDTPELHGVTFKRRKTKSKNGPKGGIIETDGSPQMIAVRDDSVFGRYKAAEKRISAINDAIKAEYAAAPVTLLKGKAGVERDRKIRELEKQKAEAQQALNQAWQRFVVTRAE